VTTKKVGHTARLQELRGLSTARRCWDLYTTHRWTHQEIAAELKISQGAVSKALARAEKAGLEALRHTRRAPQDRAVHAARAAVFGKPARLRALPRGAHSQREPVEHGQAAPRPGARRDVGAAVGDEGRRPEIPQHRTPGVSRFARTSRVERPVDRARRRTGPPTGEPDGRRTRAAARRGTRAGGRESGDAPTGTVATPGLQAATLQQLLKPAAPQL
jgi:hypothetical protein